MSAHFWTKSVHFLAAALKYDKVMAQISYNQQAGQCNTTPQGPTWMK
jgi:hypothetical protein